MKVQQIYTGCLAHGAYYIESDGEAAIIDPLREVQPYIDMAEQRGTTIKYIFETHFHADFVSGHKDLAAKTGATIVFGPTEMETGFDVHVARDGERFTLGNVEVELIHTPGHTLESSCYLLYDNDGQPESLFTGDTLFIGDVGRPDLAQKVIESLTQEKLANMMFDSLREKIMPLDDDIIVYPGHGKGSACGKNMSDETSDTLGNQKKTNYALDPSLSREEFVEKLLDGLTPPPSYFPQNVLMNIQGYDHFDEVLNQGMTPLSVETFAELAAQSDVTILDARTPDDFEQGFIPGSVNIGIDGDFAVWVGTILRDVNTKVVIVADEGREEEVVTRLARVGFDHAQGYLKGGFQAWADAGREVDSIRSVDASGLPGVFDPEADAIVDVRRKSEFDSHHVVGAINAPLDYIWQDDDTVPTDKTAYVHCAGGYRSMIFASLLKARGYDNLVNVRGGFKAIEDDGSMELTDYVCPTTLL